MIMIVKFEFKAVQNNIYISTRVHRIEDRPRCAASLCITVHLDQC